MDINDKKKAISEKLKNIPRSKCGTCKKIISHNIPMVRCFECKIKYCFDHIYCNQINDKMKENDMLRDICDKCKEKYGYRRLN